MLIPLTFNVQIYVKKSEVVDWPHMFNIPYRDVHLGHSIMSVHSFTDNILIQY